MYVYVMLHRRTGLQLLVSLRKASRPQVPHLLGSRKQDKTLGSMYCILSEMLHWHVKVSSEFRLKGAHHPDILMAHALAIQQRCR